MIILVFVITKILSRHELGQISRIISLGVIHYIVFKSQSVQLDHHTGGDWSCMRKEMAREWRQPFSRRFDPFSKLDSAFAKRTSPELPEALRTLIYAQQGARRSILINEFIGKVWVNVPTATLSRDFCATSFLTRRFYRKCREKEKAFHNGKDLERIEKPLPIFPSTRLPPEFSITSLKSLYPYRSYIRVTIFHMNSKMISYQTCLINPCKDFQH